MSGNNYEFSFYTLEELADEIERDFINDGKFQTEDWSVQYTGFDINWKRPMIEADRLEGATKEERKIILKEIKSLVQDLKKVSKRARELDLLMSGDTGPTSYLKRLKEEKLIK